MLCEWISEWDTLWQVSGLDSAGIFQMVSPSFSNNVDMACPVGNSNSEILNGAAVAVLV